MIVDKECTIGATTTRVRLTKHGTAHVTEKCGTRLREIYIPLPLLQAFMSAYNAAAPSQQEQQCQQTATSPAQSSEPSSS
jgi:hypothetical protein